MGSLAEEGEEEGVNGEELEVREEEEAWKGRGGGVV